MGHKLRGHHHLTGRSFDARDGPSHVGRDAAQAMRKGLRARRHFACTRTPGGLV